MGASKQQTKPPNIALTPSLSSSSPATKFHQRLSHSFSIRTSSSTNTNDLHRRQSFANDEKNRQPSMGNMSMLWRQQRTSTSTTTCTDSSLVYPSSVFKTPTKTSKTSSSTEKQPNSRKSSVIVAEKELPFEACSSSSYSPLDRLRLSSSPPSLNKLVIVKECLCLLLDNVNDETCESKNTLENQLHSLKIPRQQEHPASYSVLAGILKYLLHILTTLQPTIHNSFKLIDSADTPSSYTLEPTCIITFECDALWPDHLDRNTHWFRTFFCGKDYTTSLVPILLNKHSSSSSPPSTTTYAIVTAIQEPILATTTTNANRSNQSTTTKMDPCQYRLIIRHSNRTIRQVVSSTQAYHYLTGKPDSQKSTKHQRRSLRGYQPSSQQRQDHVLTAAISSVCPELDMTKAVYLTAETTMAIQLEKDLLHLDGIEIPPSYKFGVLTIKNDQTTEEEWFSNTGISPSFDHFLTLIGDRIQLKGYNGYSAGLDTKTGETGDTSVVSRWKDYEIMYHVAPLMPYRQNDKQQVQRKRYIGNDIVCLVFLEGDAIFDPKAIRSKFLHVYIVVRRETIGAKHMWRIEVVRKNNVPEFGPSLPNPPIFYDDASLQKFLTVKLINAENASLKCDNFSIPNNRARAGILESMAEKGLTQGKSANKSTLKRHKSQSQRHTDRLSRGSFHSIRSNPHHHHHHDTTTAADPPAAPPIPSPTRSTILQDLKKFALRRTPTLPSLQLRSATTTNTLKEEPITPPDDTDDEKKKPFHFTNSLLSGSAVHHGGVPNGEPMMQRSFLATKAKLPTSQDPQTGGGGGYKTDNLMINMVGRRSTSSSKHLASSLPK